MFYFLGPKSEQRVFLEEVFELILTDHIFWRRNFYPKDPPSMSFRRIHSQEAADFKEKFYQELFSLISDLKLDVPVFSPRYMAHIISEPSLPGLVAYIATMLYNPNNVSKEASSVALHYELEVGRQFADLFGFDSKKSFGHITSGGTVANYESVWFNKTSKFVPLSIHWACEFYDLPMPKELPQSQWELLNLSGEELEALWLAFTNLALLHDLDPLKVIQKLSPAELGDKGFWSTMSKRWGESWEEPVVLIPRTAHYSWQRAASIFGMGRCQFLEVMVDQEFCMCPDSYEQVLQHCLENKIPIIQTVAITGTTEFGSVDPIPELVEVRNSFTKKGLYSPIHVDAAFGGYFVAMFRAGEKEFDVTKRAFFEQSNLQELEQRFLGIEQCESVTIDPHKMGYTPYGAGAFIFKHGFQKAFVAQSAAYVFDDHGSAQGFHLGQYIFEGSKPGAAAAAVLFSNKMIPLNTDGYGHLLFLLCQEAQSFHKLLVQKQEGLQSKNFSLIPVVETQLNVVSFFIHPHGAKTLSEVNQLNKSLVKRFGVHDVESIQQYDYIVSHTGITVDGSYIKSHPILSKLEEDVESLEVIRMVFMNGWHKSKEFRGKSYMEDFLDLLIQECHQRVDGIV